MADPVAAKEAPLRVGRARTAMRWVLAGALALRLGAALWAPPLQGDAADYDRLARALVEGRGYVAPSGRPTSWRPPLYPALLAGVYRVAGERPGAVRVVQAVVGTATVAAVFALGTLLGGEGVGVVAAGLVAVDPAQVFAGSHLLSETLFTALLLAGVLAAARAAARWGTGRGGVPWGALAGALLALASLTRAVALLLPFVLLAGAALLGAPGDAPGDGEGPDAAGRLRSMRRGRGRPGLLAAGAALLCFALVLAPWAARNARVNGKLVPVATQGGVTFYAGNHPVNGWIFGLIPSDSITRRTEGMSETQASDYLFGVTLRDLARDPARTLRLEALKVLFFWVPVDWEVLPWYGSLEPIYLLTLLWAGVLVALVVRGRVGTALLRWWPAWLPLLYMFAMALVFYGSPRFRLPVDPLLAVLAGGGVVAVARRAGRRTALRALALSAAAVALLVPLTGVARAAARGFLGR